MADQTAEAEVEELLSNETGAARAIVSRVLTSSDDARVFLKNISEYVVGRKTAEEKLRTNVTNLRRARVNAGKFQIQ